uniref:Uncharacterized protein n=1 Tax=Setaria italica TaxID=4555 RepID=K3ZKY7_SETIT
MPSTMGISNSVFSNPLEQECYGQNYLHSEFMSCWCQFNLILKIHLYIHLHASIL